jgi:hypothetical protein
MKQLCCAQAVEDIPEEIIGTPHSTHFLYRSCWAEHPKSLSTFLLMSHQQVSIIVTVGVHKTAHVLLHIMCLFVCSCSYGCSLQAIDLSNWIAWVPGFLLHRSGPCAYFLESSNLIRTRCCSQHIVTPYIILKRMFASNSQCQLILDSIIRPPPKATTILFLCW